MQRQIKDMLRTLIEGTIVMFAFLGAVIGCRLCISPPGGIPFAKYMVFSAFVIALILYLIKIAFKHREEDCYYTGSWIPPDKCLPPKGALNPNTKDYQKYMCLVRVLGAKDVRPLSFSKEGRWMSETTDMTQYVIAWQQNAPFLVEAGVAVRAENSKE